MAKRKSSQNIKKFLVIALLLMVFGILGFFIVQKLLVFSQIQKPISCEDPVSIKQFISAAWKDPKTIQDVTKDYSERQSIYLLPDDKTPHLDFGGKLVASYEFQGEEATLDKFYKEDLAPKIKQSSYVLDGLSSSKPELDGDIIVKTTTDVFQSKDNLLEVTYGLSYDKEGKEIPILTIVCGIKEEKLLASYREVLQIPGVINEIQAYGHSRMSDLRFEIHEQYKDYIYAGIGSWRDGGSGIWLGKDDNGNWIVIANGQQAPDCKILEKYKAPKGTTCTDYTNNQLSTSQ